MNKYKVTIEIALGFKIICEVKAHSKVDAIIRSHSLLIDRHPSMRAILNTCNVGDFTITEIKNHSADETVAPATATAPKKSAAKKNS